MPSPVSTPATPAPVVSAGRLRIVLLCVLASVVYGIAHDQITARLCVEYFTIGHAPIFHTDSPTLLAIGWGILATFWVGALLGIPLALAATHGPRPRRTARSLVKPIAILLLCMAVVALVAGIAGHYIASSRTFVLPEPLASRLPADKHVAFITAGAAHGASYFVGFAGGLVLIWRVWKSRGPHVPEPAAPPLPPPTASEASAARRNRGLALAAYLLAIPLAFAAALLDGIDVVPERRAAFALCTTGCALVSLVLLGVSWRWMPRIGRVIALALGALDLFVLWSACSAWLAR